MNHLRQLLLAFVLISEQTAFAWQLPTFADIAEQSKKSVVNIRTESRVIQKQPRLDVYQFFLNESIPNQVGNQALGTGVILSNDGLIITNYHVVTDAKNIQVMFANKKTKASAVVVGADPKTDIALLRTSLPKGVRPADLGDSDRIRVGDWVLAIGNPFGYEYTVTSGIISAMGRVIGTGPYDNFLQTSAPIHPGNSGGPLIDMRGRVIGIATAVDSAGYGIGFAIPINMVKSVSKDLQKKGVVIRPWLGIVGKNVISQDDIKDAYDPVGVHGVLVVNLVVESPAHKGGLKMGDIIIGMNRKRITDYLQLQQLISKQKPGQIVKLRVYRRGAGYQEINIRLGTTPKADDLPPEKDIL